MHQYQRSNVLTGAGKRIAEGGHIDDKRHASSSVSL